ncbi:MAG: metal ABC transporter substrate-binding protein [Actinomycetes bacterium]
MTFRTRSALGILAAGGVLLLTACGTGSNPAAQDGKLLVATTVAPITSIAGTVGGDKVAVEGIVPEGTNSHTFEPAPQVAELLSTADIIFVNGLGLEDPTQELAQANMKDGAQLVNIGDAVLPKDQWIFDFSFPVEGGKPNPHLWTDPPYAAKYAQVIADTYAQRDPANAAYYQANAAAFVKQTKQLSAALRADQKTVPDGNLRLLTYHDAYAYFARTFGWQVIGAVQPKNFEDPTPQEVASLIDQVKAEHVPTIFGSEVFPSSVLEEIGRATGARYEDTLRDDDLPGSPGDAEHSWLGLMRYDYITMVEGLGGTADHLRNVKVENVAPDQATYPQ